MTGIIKFQSNCHWYACRDGAPEPMHDADLRVARKKLLYPSVTTIDKDEFKNDFLDRWKMNELVLAAAQYQKMPHENDEDYCNRVYQASLEKAKTAAEFGKGLHDAIENYPQMPIDPVLVPWMNAFGQWYDENIDHPLYREKIVLDHDIGVAGRCDFIGIGKGKYDGRMVIPDWKSQNVKKDDRGRKKPAYYDSWPRQLAFYAISFAKEQGLFPTDIPVCLSVVIDSNEPETPFVKEWTKDEIISSYQDFVIASYRWFKRKRYFPHPNGMFSLTPSVAMPQ